jgi:hypothetical protein
MLANDAQTQVVDVNSIPDGWQVLTQDQIIRPFKEIMESKRYCGMDLWEYLRLKISQMEPSPEELYCRGYCQGAFHLWAVVTQLQ